jgi:hypothetical protein
VVKDFGVFVGVKRCEGMMLVVVVVVVVVDDDGVVAAVVVIVAAVVVVASAFFVMIMSPPRIIWIRSRAEGTNKKAAQIGSKPVCTFETVVCRHFSSRHYQLDIKFVFLRVKRQQTHPYPPTLTKTVYADDLHTGF